MSKCLAEPLITASLDSKTAFDVANPRLIVNVLEETNGDGWLFASLLEEMLTRVVRNLNHARTLVNFPKKSDRVVLKLARLMLGSLDVY